MIEPREVKLIVSPGELAIRLKEGRVMRDSLVQQIGRLQQIPILGGAGAPSQNEILSAAIKIEGGNIGGWRAFNS